jgi:uncharacterized protein YcbK (DUF882 family)
MTIPGCRRRSAFAVALLAAASLLARTGDSAPHPPRRASPRAYADAAKRWHTVAEDERPELDETGRPKLVLHVLNTGERASLVALSDDGGFDAASLDRAAHVLRDQRTGKEFPTHPAALDLLYRAQRAFGAPLVRIVSGYRAPKGKGHSNHGRGRAIDVVVPGVTDDALSGWAKQQGFVGVGLYPVGKFCHLDIRPQSYFWRDTSGPGGRSREQPLRGRAAALADEAAKRAGSKPFSPHHEPSAGVEPAWRATGGVTASEPAESESEAEDH